MQTKKSYDKIIELNKNIDKIQLDNEKHVAKNKNMNDNVNVNVNININKNENLEETKNVFEFQIIDWNSYHEVDEDDVDNYVIQLFGRTETDKDVCLKVTGYSPHFYVEIPDMWSVRQVNIFIENI